MPLSPRALQEFNEYTVEADLSALGLGDEDLEEVFGLLKQYPNIVSVDLSENAIFFDKQFLKQLTEIETIRALYIRNTSISGVKGKEEEIVQHLLNMPNLQLLDVSLTNISDASATKLAEKEGLLYLNVRQNRKVLPTTLNEIHDHFRGGHAKWMSIQRDLQSQLNQKKAAQQVNIEKSDATSKEGAVISTAEGRRSPLH